MCRWPGATRRIESGTAPGTRFGDRCAPPAGLNSLWRIVENLVSVEHTAAWKWGGTSRRHARPEAYERDSGIGQGAIRGKDAVARVAARVKGDARSQRYEVDCGYSRMAETRWYRRSTKRPRARTNVSGEADRARQ